MTTIRTFVCVFVLALASAACSGGSSVLTPNHTPAPASSATSTATTSPSPTPTPSPAATTSSFSLGSAALQNTAVSEPIPVPSGYTENITIPLVNTAANTSVIVASGVNAPAGLAPLSRSRGRSTFGQRRADSSDPYSTIFYTSFQPSAAITVAGNISANQAFPAGTLSTTTPYYLGFYDTTQSSPSWQTIAGPVMSTDGLSLTFSGTVGSTTLAANALYGFAIFSTVSPTATPPPAPQTLVYFGDNPVMVTSESGTVENTLGIQASSFDLDDTGNLYAENYVPASPSPTLTITKYSPGGVTPLATYSPSQIGFGILTSSGSGEVALQYIPDFDASSHTTLLTDVWDAGVTGAPSRTLNTIGSGIFYSYVMTHDGTLYLSDTSASGAPQYDVFPPGASTPTSVIPETIVQPSQYSSFAPNYEAVGPDGTLYVTEYTYTQPDPLAGPYIYPPGGMERFIPAAANANGPGPAGVDVDASGNIYVANANFAYTSNSCQEDTLSEITVYSSTGSLLRTIPTMPGPIPVTVAADGTLFYSTYGAGCDSTGGMTVATVAPGSTMSLQIANVETQQIVLFDGTHKTNPYFSGRGASLGHGGAGTRAIRRARFLRRRYGSR